MDYSMSVHYENLEGLTSELYKAKATLFFGVRSVARIASVGWLKDNNNPKFQGR